jgi:hypothetical protein
MWGTSVISKNLLKVDRRPFGRKFAQSGHPAEKPQIQELKLKIEPPRRNLKFSLKTFLVFPPMQNYKKIPLR